MTEPFPRTLTALGCHEAYFRSTAIVSQNVGIGLLSFCSCVAVPRRSRTVTVQAHLGGCLNVIVVILILLNLVEQMLDSC